MYRACAAVGRAGGGAAPLGAVTGGGAGALARFRASRSRASAAKSGAGTPWSLMCHAGGAVPWVVRRVARGLNLEQRVLNADQPKFAFRGTLTKGEPSVTPV